MTSQTVSAKETSPHFLQLDGLRAIAVSLVMLWHYLPLDDPFRETFRWGWFGVRLFFVLSGFLITYILLRESDRSASPRVSQIVGAFYVRRALRIFPLYYAYVILLLITTKEMGQYLPWFLLYLQNVLFFQSDALDLVPGAALLWTLAFEEQFYLLWPTVLLFTPRAALRYVMATLIAIGVLTRLSLVLLFDDIAVGTAMVFPTSNLDSMVLGATLAYARQYATSSARLTTALNWLGVVGGIFLVAQAVLWSTFGVRIGTSPLERGFFVLSDFFVGLFFVWLIDAAVNKRTRWFGAILEFPFLTWVGKVSYGVYVLHIFVAHALVLIVDRLTGIDFGSRSYVLLIPSIALSLATAGLSWKFYEAPINRLKSKFPYTTGPHNRTKGT